MNDVPGQSVILQRSMQDPLIPEDFSGNISPDMVCAHPSLQNFADTKIEDGDMPWVEVHSLADLDDKNTANHKSARLLRATLFTLQDVLQRKSQSSENPAVVSEDEVVSKDQQIAGMEQQKQSSGTAESPTMLSVQQLALMQKLNGASSTLGMSSKSTNALSIPMSLNVPINVPLSTPNIAASMPMLTPTCVMASSITLSHQDKGLFSVSEPHALKIAGGLAGNALHPNSSNMSQLNTKVVTKPDASQVCQALEMLGVLPPLQS